MKKQPPKSKQKPQVKPEVDAPILAATNTHDSGQTKLDTGMRVSEAIEQARFWWDNKGRFLIKDKNHAPDNPGAGFFTPDPTTEAEAENSLPSNILKGKIWSYLTKPEKLHIAKHWHHEHIRVSSIDPELYLRAIAQPGKCFYCDDDTAADEVLPNGEQRELCWSHFMHRYPEEAKATFTEKEGYNDNDAEN